MSFEFATANRILFGDGMLERAGTLANEMGRHALLVTGGHPERAASLHDLLTRAGLAVTTISIKGEPKVEDILDGVATARRASCDHVIGFGGGSAVDAGKAIAALITNPGDVYDYLEVIGNARPLQQPPAPYMAIPTTAGTGSEVTRNAVLASPAHRVKVSLRSPAMLPRIALVDPQLTHSTPPAVTAASGLDALTQVIEPYVSARANPLTDAICREGIRYAVRSLRRVYTHGDDGDARRDMAFASLCGGLALANAGLGAVHGFAGPFGGMYDAPHGAICAALLPAVFGANVAALAARASGSPILARFYEVAAMLTGDPSATPQEATVWLRELCHELQIPSLATYGYARSHASDLIAKARASSSMKANPIALTDSELNAILEEAV
ncbi:MAG: iron-containing alcohol dehydrogenase [Caldilineaceae bacterium]|nr:iron-containing alcohol dehydrogenase [Caldilineaceae bacterium]